MSDGSKTHQHPQAFAPFEWSKVSVEAFFLGIVVKLQQFSNLE